MAKTIAELRTMQRAQLNRLNKEALIESILAPEEEVETQLRRELTKITSELALLRQDITSPDSIINQKLSTMQAQIDQQASVIKQQQQFLEEVDKREREKKLVVLGVPDEDEALNGATSDTEKLRKVWNEVGENTRIHGHRRLGRRDGNVNRKRPILVEVESREVRDSILRKTSKLKEGGAAYQRIFIKKDVHPSVRNEWKRLREAENLEKNRPENVGCVIRLDPRERKLYRDDVVIDSWSASYF